MSSPEPVGPSRSARASRPVFAACVAALLMAVAGCTARPLYGDVTAATGTPRSSTQQSLTSVAVKPVDDRVGQEVRNQLIFLLAGGAGQPSNPAYTLTLRTSSRTSAAAVVQATTTDLEPTSSLVTVRARYTLADAAGNTIAAGTRNAQAAFDVSRQAFSAVRAERDAQNRAARELAEQLRLAVAQDLERPSSSASPAIVNVPEDVEEDSSGWGRTDNVLVQ